MSHFYLPPSALDFYNEEEWALWLEAEHKNSSQKVHDIVEVSVQQTQQQQDRKQYRHAKLYQLSLKKQGRAAWAKLFTSVFSESQLELWERKIPNFGCTCKDSYNDWKSINTPVFPLSFEWKHTLKAAVNEKLGDYTLDIETARHVWRQIGPIRRRRKVVAVSSLSPNNLSRQLQCIQSWLHSGFKVVLMQTKSEIKAYSRLVHGVKFVESSTERPLIKEMAQHGIIINSDCEMRGHGPESFELNNFYLRWNYLEGRASREEEWGLDACYVDPKILPDDFTFQIGKPFWDYAVPAILLNKQIEFKINHIPWLHHLKHKLNWSQEDWREGHQWVLERFTGDYSSPSYRASIDQDHIYNKQLGMWVKK